LRDWTSGKGRESRLQRCPKKSVALEKNEEEKAGEEKGEPGKRNQ